MSKWTKLKKDPVAFVRDSKIYRQYLADLVPVPESKRDAKPHASTDAAPKAHPLPTLNLAEETVLSEADLKAYRRKRHFCQWQASDAARDRTVERISEQMRAFLVSAGFPDRSYQPDVRDFWGSFRSNPAGGARRTTATGSLLWVFVLARAIQPKVIVESGVFKGASLHTLRGAMPDARIHAYDIDLSNVMVKDESIRFYEGDWSEAFPQSESPEDFCYFDDHINNCLRVRQAYDLGFRHVLIDDSPDIGQLHVWRYPGVPTIQMVENRSLEPGEWVEWIWKNRRLRYVYREEDSYGAADLVEHVAELPTLVSLTGRPAGVQTYVRLKRNPKA